VTVRAGLWLALVAACTSSVGMEHGDAGAGGDGGGTGSDAAPGDGQLAIDAAPSALTPGQSTISLTAAETARTAILYVPASATAASQLAIALHGNGDTAANFLATSGLKALADADGTVLVVPQGIQRTVVVQALGQSVPNVAWDAYNTAAQGNLDLPLLDALRAQLAGQVDANHVFVIGYSQGGYLSFEYGMIAGASLSCAAVLAASSPFGGGSGDPLINTAARKLAVVLQIGTNDSAYAAAQATVAALQAKSFPTQLNAIQGAGHVPIPGDIATPWSYCRGMAL
jgi:poly(3-hydroxybutyrate) depolymerase